jgi:hypothetical protein
LQLVQAAAHAAASGAVLAADLPPWLATAFLLLVGASLARSRRAPMAESFTLGGDGQFYIVGPEGSSPVSLHPHTLVLSFLVVLLYRQESRLRSITVLADSLAPEDFRQLRLWLRWRSEATGNRDDPQTGQG